MENNEYYCIALIAEKQDLGYPTSNQPDNFMHSGSNTKHGVDLLTPIVELQLFYDAKYGIADAYFAYWLRDVKFFKEHSR